MKKNLLVLFTMVITLFCLCLVASAEGVAKTAIPLSPGKVDGKGIVEQTSPTFSWSGVDWAVSYKLAVFAVVNGETPEYSEMNARVVPLISKRIPGQALAWTPSADEGLSWGGDYVWYVAAVDDNGNEIWSRGKGFQVISAINMASFETGLKKKLQEFGISSDHIAEIFASARGECQDIVKSKTKKRKDQHTSDPGIYGPLGTENSDYTYYGMGAGGTSTASGNSFFGYAAGKDNTTGNNNTFLGHNAGDANTEGYANTFTGRHAGGSNTSGYGNNFSGSRAGEFNTSGHFNLFVGANSGRFNSTGNNNTFLGIYSGYNNTTASANTFTGFYSGYENTIGTSNAFYGFRSGTSNTEGYANLFSGRESGYHNTSGNQNVFLGCYAGLKNDTGGSNTFLGTQAGYNNQAGDGNIFLGYRAGYNETGSDKLYIDNSNTTTPLIWGDFSTDVMSINGNLGIGTTSPSSEIEISKSGVSPVFNIIRTDGAHFRLVAGKNNVQVGSVSAHGIKYLAGGSWKMQLNADGTLYMADGGSYNGTWNDASSREFKENITSLGTAEALATLEGLDPVKFNYKKDKEELHAGFIAEDVPELVASKTRKNLSAMDIVAVLTKVVKEQHQLIKAQEQRIIRLQRLFERIAKK